MNQSPSELLLKLLNPLKLEKVDIIKGGNGSIKCYVQLEMRSDGSFILSSRSDDRSPFNGHSVTFDSNDLNVSEFIDFRSNDLPGLEIKGERKNGNEFDILVKTDSGEFRVYMYDAGSTKTSVVDCSR